MPRSTWKVPTGEGRQTAASQAREAWAESRERPVTPCQLTQLDRQPAAAASRVDGTGNRFFGSCAQQAQLRELRRTRPFGRGFPSFARVAPLPRVAATAGCPPHHAFDLTDQITSAAENANAKRDRRASTIEALLVLSKQLASTGQHRIRLRHARPQWSKTRANFF
jgi:hypothetical protein